MFLSTCSGAAKKQRATANHGAALPGAAKKRPALREPKLFKKRSVIAASLIKLNTVKKGKLV
jgi:hypothetical protein